MLIDGGCMVIGDYNKSYLIMLFFSCFWDNAFRMEANSALFDYYIFHALYKE